MQKIPFKVYVINAYILEGVAHGRSCFTIRDANYN